MTKKTFTAILMIFFLAVFLYPRKKSDYSRTQKLLRRYNNYWDQAETTDKKSLHLFDAFTIQGKKFNFKNILKKKLIIITFSDDFHLKLTSFWYTRDCDYIPQHASRLYFINVLQPTQNYYTLYKRGYERALKKHIGKMKSEFVKDLGRNLRKDFRKVKVTWIFDYRLEIARAYRMKNKRGVFIYDFNGKLVKRFTGSEPDLKKKFNSAIKSALKKEGYYLYEKD